MKEKEPWVGGAGRLGANSIAATNIFYDLQQIIELLPTLPFSLCYKRKFALKDQSMLMRGSN